jgi:hypothetical protein
MTQEKSDDPEKRKCDSCPSDRSESTTTTNVHVNRNSAATCNATVNDAIEGKDLRTETPRDSRLYQSLHVKDVFA